MKNPKLDFSEFHPLDHSVFSCYGYPGGVERHLALMWKYQLKDAVGRNTLCRIGIHDYVDFFDSNDKTFVSCSRCLKDKDE